MFIINFFVLSSISKGHFLIRADNDGHFLFVNLAITIEQEEWEGGGSGSSKKIEEGEKDKGKEWVIFPGEKNLDTGKAVHSPLLCSYVALSTLLNPSGSMWE